MQAADPGETGRREQRDPFTDHTAGALPATTGRHQWRLAVLQQINDNCCCAERFRRCFSLMLILLCSSIALRRPCIKVERLLWVNSFVSSILVTFLAILALDQALGDIVARVMGELAEVKELGVEFERGVV